MRRALDYLADNWFGILVALAVASTVAHCELQRWGVVK